MHKLDIKRRYLSNIAVSKQIHRQASSAFPHQDLQIPDGCHIRIINKLAPKAKKDEEAKMGSISNQGKGSQSEELALFEEDVGYWVEQ
jgi:hypothetical protein